VEVAGSSLASIVLGHGMNTLLERYQRRPKPAAAPWSAYQLRDGL